MPDGSQRVYKIGFVPTMDIPVEGVPRQCIYWAGWDEYDSDGKYLGEHQIHFDAGAPPQIAPIGGLAPTDIVVDGEKGYVFFTLYDSGHTFPEGNAPVTLTLSDGTVAKFEYGLSFTTALSFGLDGLKDSVRVINDGGFALAGSGNVLDGFLKRFLPSMTDCDEILQRMQKRIAVPPTQDDIDDWNTTLAFTPFGYFDDDFMSDDWFRVFDRAEPIMVCINRWLNKLGLPLAVLDGNPFTASSETPLIVPGQRVLYSTAAGNVVLPPADVNP